MTYTVWDGVAAQPVLVALKFENSTEPTPDLGWTSLLRLAGFISIILHSKVYHQLISDSLQSRYPTVCSDYLMLLSIPFSGTTTEQHVSR